MSAFHVVLIGSALRCAKCGMKAHKPDRFCDPRPKKKKERKR